MNVNVKESLQEASRPGLSLSNISLVISDALRMLLKQVIHSLDHLLITFQVRKHFLSTYYVLNVRGRMGM